MSLKEEKINNIKVMLKELGDIHRNMSKSQLKNDYRRFLYFIQSKKSDFKMVFLYIEKRIEMFEKSLNMMEGIDNKGIVRFWKKIRDIILKTYEKNKDIDRSINGR